MKLSAESYGLPSRQCLHLTQKNGSQLPAPGDGLDKFNLHQVTLGGNFITTSVMTIFCSICCMFLERELQDESLCS
jgi:hypothetical protein